MVNEEDNHTILGEFKRTLDTSEQYYDDLKRKAGVKHSPMLTGLKERSWKVSQASLVAGYRSVSEAEWINALGTFDTDKRECALSGDYATRHY